jgi:hypothetical protein
MGSDGTERGGAEFETYLRGIRREVRAATVSGKATSKQTIVPPDDLWMTTKRMMRMTTGRGTRTAVVGLIAGAALLLPTALAAQVG